ncbi:MAG: HEAT repeat domain-containing protein, partial [Phycisphaerae bacterium]|nr:HEAT repeat domain-containing protein [Phycisphaerae bacterium]
MLKTGIGIILLCLMGSLSSTWAQSTTNIGLPKSTDVSKLSAVLQNPDTSLFDKACACQQLAIVGGRDSVMALAPLLADEKLGNYARSALEEIHDAAAGDALRAAMEKLQGKLLIGVVNSIGVRRDARAVAGLIEVAQNPSRGAAREAVLALGRIANDEASDFLEKILVSGPGELRSAAAEGCVRVAEQVMAQGKQESAMKLYDAVGRADVPQPLRLAALRGSVLSRQSAGIPLLLENLDSDDLEFREVALGIAREIPGSGATQALAGFLKTARPTVQVGLLKVLIDRNDPSVCGAVEALAESDLPQVRTAVMQALGKIGGPTSVPILLKSVATGETGEADAAAESLRRISASNADALILEAVPSATPEVKARLIGLLGFRGATIATKELLKQADSDNPAVAKAAFVALASVAPVSDLPEVIGLTLTCKDDTVREKAERTAYEIAAKNPDLTLRSHLVVDAYQKAEDPKAKCSLLRILAMIGGADSCRQLLWAYQDSDGQVRETAFRALVEWPDSMPASFLLEVFTQSTDKVWRTLALRGLVR